jgi:hypothetical protein
MGFVGLQLYGTMYGNNRYPIRYDHIMKCPNLGVIKRHKRGRTRPLLSYKFLIWNIRKFQILVRGTNWSSYIDIIILHETMKPYFVACKFQSLVVIRFFLELDRCVKVIWWDPCWCKWGTFGVGELLHGIFFWKPGNPPTGLKLLLCGHHTLLSPWTFMISGILASLHAKVTSPI